MKRLASSLILFSLTAIGVAACSAGPNDSAQSSQQEIGGGVAPAASSCEDTSGVQAVLWSPGISYYGPRNKQFAFVELPDTWATNIAYAAVDVITRQVQLIVWVDVSRACDFLNENRLQPMYPTQAPCTNPPSPSGSRCTIDGLSAPLHVDSYFPPQVKLKPPHVACVDSSLVAARAKCVQEY